jgi:hypothetical protein
MKGELGTLQVLGGQDDGSQVVILDETADLGCLRRLDFRRWDLWRAKHNNTNDFGAIPAHQEHLANRPV